MAVVPAACRLILEVMGAGTAQAGVPQASADSAIEEQLRAGALQLRNRGTIKGRSTTASQ